MSRWFDGQFDPDRSPGEKKLRRWIKRRLFPDRYDFDSRGKLWVHLLCCAIFVLVAVYVACKWHYADDRQPDYTEFVRIDGGGIATVLSPHDIDWYVGETNFLPIKERFANRNQQIEQLRQQTYARLGDLSSRLGPTDGDRLASVTASVSQGWLEAPSNKNRLALAASLESLRKKWRDVEDERLTYRRELEEQRKSAVTLTLRLKLAVEELDRTIVKTRAVLSADPSQPPAASSTELKATLTRAKAGVAQFEKALTEATGKVSAVDFGKRVADTKKALETVGAALTAAQQNSAGTVTEKRQTAAQQAAAKFEKTVADTQSRIAAAKLENALTEANRTVRVFERALKEASSQAATAKWKKQIEAATTAAEELAARQAEIAAKVSPVDLDQQLKTARDAAKKLSETLAEAPSLGDKDQCIADLCRLLKGLESEFGAVASPPAAFQTFLTGLAESERGKLPSSVVTELQIAMAKWRQLRGEQIADRDVLRPSKNVTFFAVTPQGLLVENLFWALLGVLTNLAFRTADVVRKKQYRPVERFVGFSKMAYGPVVSLILCLCVMHGMVDLGGYQVRSWMLPLIAFLFGFASRRTANVIDQLSSKVLGDAAKSIEEGPAVVQRRIAERVQKLNLPPAADLTTFKTNALRQAEVAVRAAVAVRQQHV